jgi:hypothetical protein
MRSDKNGFFRVLVECLQWVLSEKEMQLVFIVCCNRVYAGCKTLGQRDCIFMLETRERQRFKHTSIGFMTSIIIVLCFRYYVQNSGERSKMQQRQNWRLLLKADGSRRLNLWCMILIPQEAVNTRIPFLNTVRKIEEETCRVLERSGRSATVTSQSCH